MSVVVSVVTACMSKGCWGRLDTQDVGTETVEVSSMNMTGTWSTDTVEVMGGCC